MWLVAGAFLGPGSLWRGAAEPAEGEIVSRQADHVPLRPRLLFVPVEMERLKARIEDEPTMRAAWQRQLERADRFLEEKLVTLDLAEGGQGQHGNYGRPSSQLSGMAGTLGLAYRMTGDRRYADKLKAALLHYGKLKRWAGDAGWDPPWHSELNTARFCFGYALALRLHSRCIVRSGGVRAKSGKPWSDWVLGRP